MSTRAEQIWACNATIDACKGGCGTKCIKLGDAADQLQRDGELRERLAKLVEEMSMPCDQCAPIGEGLCPHCIEARKCADKLSALLKETSDEA